MNKLPLEKRVQILQMLCEGSSMRSISRVCDVSINTVSKLLVDAGRACLDFHDRKVTGLTCQRIQCDEIWSFCYAKDKNVRRAKAAPTDSGDVWTWTSIDADTKLICNWVVGQRDADWAHVFMQDLKSRLTNRVQLTSDGYKTYLQAVDDAFGEEIDYAQLVKIYGAVGEASEARYSPAECIGIKKRTVTGNPEETHISTSYVERQNLQMRMSMKRFARLTNAHSKKLANHRHALSLYFVFYNWVRIHKTLRVTPAMAAGLTDRLLDWDEVVGMIDQFEATRFIEKAN